MINGKSIDKTNMIVRAHLIKKILKKVSISKKSSCNYC